MWNIAQSGIIGEILSFGVFRDKNILPRCAWWCNRMFLASVLTSLSPQPLPFLKEVHCIFRSDSEVVYFLLSWFIWLIPSIQHIDLREKKTEREEAPQKQLGRDSEQKRGKKKVEWDLLLHILFPTISQLGVFPFSTTMALAICMFYCFPLCLTSKRLTHLFLQQFHWDLQPHLTLWFTLLLLHLWCF
jgi:hypothetical protein